MHPGRLIVAAAVAAAVALLLLSSLAAETAVVEAASAGTVPSIWDALPTTARAVVAAAVLVAGTAAVAGGRVGAWTAAVASGAGLAAGALVRRAAAVSADALDGALRAAGLGTAGPGIGYALEGIAWIVAVLGAVWWAVWADGADAPAPSGGADRYLDVVIEGSRGSAGE